MIHLYTEAAQSWDFIRVIMAVSVYRDADDLQEGVTSVPRCYLLLFSK